MHALQQLVTEARREFAAGNLEEARLLCLAGLAEFPDSPQLLTVLGWVYAQRKDLRNAEATFRHALCHDARSFDAHSGLAAVLAASERHAEAKGHYTEAIALHADDVDTLFNYGSTLISLRRFGDAIEQLLRAAELDSANVSVLHNLAIAHAQLGRWEATVEFCDRTLAIDPNAFQSQLLRGMARVALGSFAEGWDDYESRYRLQDHYGRRFGLKIWNGESTNAGSLIVLPEQGIGTQLMFASCLPDLLRRVSRVTLACDPRLVALMKRSFPSVVTVVDGLLPALIRNGGYDAYTMAGSLPQHLRRSTHSFPEVAYLVAEPALRLQWRERLSQLGRGLKVGVSWGGAAEKMDTLHRRTDPQAWWPLATVPDIHWINLQCDATPSDLAAWHQLAGGRFHELPDFDKKYDLENFAAVVSELDLVITVVNSTVHFAGALGTPTWMLVPLGGEWRWQARGEKCLWHKSVRLFRQQRLDDWSGVFARLRRELKARARTLSSPRRTRAA
jgi:hypothetical protein